MKKTFAVQNEKDWRNVHHSIFGSTIPKYMEWTNHDEIISILAKISRVENSNEIFLPKRGGMTLEGVGQANETGCIELFCGIPYIIKPKSLSFVSVDNTLAWNYFWIETENMMPSVINSYIQTASYTESVIELSPEDKYVDRFHWDIGEYGGQSLPDCARPVVRLLKGSLVIFKKLSPYNTTRAYNGTHEKMGTQAFEQYIKDAQDAHTNPKHKLQIIF